MIFKVFTVNNNNFYLYNREKNSICKIDRETYTFLNHNNDIESSNNKIMNSLYERGVLTPNNLKKIENQPTTDIMNKLNTELSSITLQLTQKCNLMCDYCRYASNDFYSGRKHSNLVMQDDLISKSIDFLARSSTNSNHIIVSFYGGEPTLEKEKIIFAMNYCRKKFIDKKITFSMTTNATKLDVELIDFIKDFDFHLLISFDGPKEIHDINRPFYNGKGSFNVIKENILKIKQMYPEFYEKIRFNTVVNPKNDYGKLVDFYNNSEFIKPEKTNLSLMSDAYTLKEINYNSEYRSNYKFEQLKAILMILNKLNFNKTYEYYKLSNDLLSYKEKFKIIHNPPEVFHHHGPCIPGMKTVFIDVNGRFYPCEKVNELSKTLCIGDINDGFYLKKIEELSNIGKLSEEECRNCWAFHHCRICALDCDDYETNRISRNKKVQYCDSSKNSALNDLKSYVFFKEFNYA